MKLISGASALALAGGALAFAAPAANAAVTAGGSCSGGRSNALLKPNLTDQTQAIKVASKSFEAGTCTGTHVAPGAASGQPPATLNIAAGGSTSSVSGNSSCANGASAQAADANAANAYSLNGKIGWKSATQLDALGHPWAISGYFAILGIGQNGNGPDVIDVGGIVVKGAAVGAQIKGSLYEDPTKKDKAATTTGGYSVLDVPTALAVLGGCANGTPNDVGTVPGATAPGIGSVQVGSGPSPIFGSASTGISFQYGE